MDKSKPRPLPQPAENEEAGEIFGPASWRPVERRWFFKFCCALIGGGVSGYGTYPWVAGDRRHEVATFLDEQWQAIKEPRKNARSSLHATNDLHEDQIQSSKYTRNLPVLLDAEGQAYQTFLASLDLKHIQPIELLRPHFKCRGTVMNRLPPRELWKNIAPTIKVADKLREKLGVPLIHISSAYRCPAYNSACPGAAPQSYHIKNMALDLVYACPPEKVAEAAAAMRSQGIFKGGIGRYSSFIHIDTRGKSADWGSVRPQVAKA